MDLIPAHAMTIHPGPANQFSHCVWKAPAAGRYDIEASFTPLSTGGPHAYMLKNGVSIGDSLLPAGTPWSCSFKSMQLAAGDTIDAVVGVGNNGGYFNDLTQFSFTVTTDHGMRADETASAVVRQLKAPLREMIRQELQEALAGSAADHAINSFPVDAASSAWQNSGVRVNAGQHVLVEADKNEKWNLGQRLTDANGYSIVPPNAGTATYHTGTVNDDWHWGALICAVGNGRAEIKDPKHQMEIGTKRSFTAIGAGYLYFLCNDSPNLPDGGSGFDDNSGIIHVKVTVSDSACCAPPAIPATSALPSVTSTDGQNTTAN
jgi:hypothetical protein